MESARHVPPKISSLTHSAASKDEPMQTPPIQHSLDVKVDSVKEVGAASEEKAVNETVQSLEKKSLKNTNQSGATPESMSTKEPISPESAQVPEESQEKFLGGEQGLFICICSMISLIFLFI